MWRRMGEEIPKPKAILSISAHWYVSQKVTPARTIPRISRFLTLVGWCGGEVQRFKVTSVIWTSIAFVEVNSGTATGELTLRATIGSSARKGPSLE
jgi:aromatic ring-opening dioxygenase catalytic subunit (LigB family)